MAFNRTLLDLSAIPPLPIADDDLSYLVQGGAVNSAITEAGRAGYQNARNARVNVLDYGAVGDGLTDDSTAIQAAIAAVAATGGTLFFPPRIYLACNLAVTGAITLTGPGATLRSPVLLAGDGSPILDIQTAGVTVRDLAFDGQRAGQPLDGYSDSFNTGGGGRGRAYRALIRADGDTFFPLSNLRVTGCYFTGAYGAAIAAQNLDRVWIQDNQFEQNNFEAAFLYVDAGLTNDEAIITGNVIRQCGAGDPATQANGLVVSKYRRAIVSQNTAWTFERNFVKFEHCERVVCQGNTCELNSIDSFGGIQTQGVTAAILISDNVISQCGAGITLNHSPAADQVIVTGNIIDQTLGPTTGDGIIVSAAPLNDSLIANNTLTGIIRYGLTIAAGAARSRLAENVIGGNHSTAFSAIYVNGAAATDQLQIVGNVISDYDGAAGGNGVIRVLGAGLNTNLVIKHNSIIVFDSTRRAIFIDTGAAPSGLMDGNLTNGSISGIVGNGDGAYLGGLRLNGVTVGRWEQRSITLASGAVAQLLNAAGSLDNTMGFVFINNVSQAQGALYYTFGPGVGVSELLDNSGNYTPTKGNPGTTNVYWDAGNARYEIQNNQAAARTYHLHILVAA